MTAKTMAEVLRQVQKDHGHVHTYRGGAQGCMCGQRDPSMRGSNSWIWGHVAQVSSDALTAAGFGLVADAWDEGQKSGMRHADRVIAAHKIGRPDLPGPPSVNPYRRPE